MTIKRHKAIILSRRRCSDARQKFSPCDFSFANSCCKIHISCAKFIISSHLATMAIGSANPDRNFRFFAVFLKNRNIISKIKRSKVTDYAALKFMNRPNDIVCCYKQSDCLIFLHLIFIHRDPDKLSGQLGIYAT